MYDGTVATMWQDNNYKDFTDSLSRLLLYSSDNVGRLFYTTATVSYHELARKQLVDNAQGEWILMLDTDHAFGPDLLERLLFYKNQNKSRVISGIYQYKHPPHAPVANFWTPEGKLSPLVNWDRRGDIMSEVS